MPPIWPEDWGAILAPQVPLAEQLLRVCSIYLILILLLRATGRRVVGRITTADLLVVVLLAASVRRGLVAESPSVTDALVMAALLVGLDWMIQALSLRVSWIAFLIHPAPLLIIRDGRIVPENARRELLSREEIEEALRLEGIESVREVERAYVEPSGQISVTRSRHPGAGNGRQG